MSILILTFSPISLGKYWIIYYICLGFKSVRSNSSQYNMPANLFDNISPDALRWAFQRAGHDEESAVKLYPRLAAWLSGEKRPTARQLQDFSEKFHVPIGYLFLEKRPVESLPFPMFRGDAGLNDHFDLNIYEMVMTTLSRQNWLEDYLTENEIDTCQIVGAIDIFTPVREAVTLLRKELHLEPRWAFSLASVEAAIAILTQRLEDAGFFISFSGIVGNNTHRPIKVSECRGFALVSDVAPYIFINSSDSKNAQMFTIIHEAAHIMLGISAGHAGTDFAEHHVTERYCDLMAAEFLVPSDLLKEIWNGDIKDMSKRFRVSEAVIARSAYDLNLINRSVFNAFWAEYNSRPSTVSNKKSGGDFYRTSVKRVGKLFAIHVRNAVGTHQLSFTDAYRLTGLYGDTYQHFMTNNI